MIIYKVTNLINGKMYIGQTKQGLKERMIQHKSDAFNVNSNMYNACFQKAIRKYGWDNFKWEIIDEASSEEELNEKEKYWIKYYNTCIHEENSNGYNMTYGGDGTVGVNGENHGQAKLSEKDVIEIKNMLVNGYSQYKIADKFNVDRTTIGRIATGENWKHVVVDGWKEFLSKVHTNEGENNGMSKLSRDEVIEIKKLLIQGKKQVDIAKQFNVNRGTIQSIANGDNWSHIVVDGWKEYLEKRKEKPKKRRLKEEEVEEIKRLLDAGHKKIAIAKQFNVTIGTIVYISKKLA